MTVPSSEKGSFGCCRNSRREGSARHLLIPSLAASMMTLKKVGLGDFPLFEALNLPQDHELPQPWTRCFDYVLLICFLPRGNPSSSPVRGANAWKSAILIGVSAGSAISYHVTLSRLRSSDEALKLNYGRKNRGVGLIGSVTW